MSVSKKPRLSHPWSRLTLKEGKVVLGTDRAAATGYLELPPISIKAKREAKSAADGIRTAFAFTLNAAPDATWLELFDANLDDRPPGILRSELKVEIGGDELKILCLPSHLERIYAFVKAAISITNDDYQAARAEVARKLEGLGQTLEIEALEEKNRVEAAKREFDNLQL